MHAVTYAREPNRTGLDMEILDVIDQTARQVVLDLVNDHRGADIDQLDVGVMLLILINGFVNLLVVPDASAEIQRSHLGILTLVIRGRGLNFEDVVHDDLFIITCRFNEQCLDACLFAGLIDPAASISGGIGGIQDSDDTFSGVEPGNHIRDSSSGGRSPHFFPFLVVGFKELGGWLRRVVTTITADVEDPSGNANPGQISYGLSGNETFASSRKANHDHTDFCIIGL